MGKDGAADGEHPMSIDGLDTLRYERIPSPACGMQYVVNDCIAFSRHGAKTYLMAPRRP